MVTKRIKRFLHNPSKVITAILLLLGKILPDNIFLRIQYKHYFGKKLNLKLPLTFNEKIQWLKLYDRKDIYTTMVDKLEAKKWVAERIGEKYIIPTIGEWESVSEINFDSLPNQFVLKTNHDSGGIIICKDKNSIDIPSSQKILSRSMNSDYYIKCREWPYKNVKRRIFAEAYMEDESGYELKDYKIFCFGGKPEFIQVDFDRFASTGHKRNVYSKDWTLMDISYGYPSDPSHMIEKPVNLKEMLRLASILSDGLKFLRVDFYSINGAIKFGELTFFPGAGLEKITPEEWNLKLGDLIKL